MFDLAAPLQAGLSAAGIRLTTSIADVIAGTTPVRVHQHRSDWATYVFEAVDVTAHDGRVAEICVKAGYEGKLAGAIGIGSTIADVERVIGKVTQDEYDNLVVATVEGWSFETSEWRGNSLQANKAARIVSMCVYAARSKSSA
jgi:ribulose 1,5-bisphosphate synthetase/thiazole synthase